MGRSDLGQRKAALQLVGKIVRSDSQDFSRFGGQPAKVLYHSLGPFLESNPGDDRSEFGGHRVNLSLSQGAVLDQGSQSFVDHLFCCGTSGAGPSRIIDRPGYCQAARDQSNHGHHDGSDLQRRPHHISPLCWCLHRRRLMFEIR